ncbi:hypothetical protein [Nocardia sp. NPDC020380]|uniref:hypothetical protein n=1 Tax=Nocardia sp. NPDC020380 TaxID=3364309 RepID=UPI0037AE48FC
MGFLGGVFGSNRRQFGEQALAMVRENEVVARAEFDAGEFEIHYWTHSGEIGRINLNTVFKRTRRASPEEADRMLATFVAIGPQREGEEPDGWAAAAPRLRPLIRQAGLLGQRIEGLRVGDHTLWRPVLPCLMESVVVDWPTSMQTVTPHNLTEWGVDADTVFATARANLAGLALDTVAGYDPAVKGGMLYLPDTSGDSYAGALPLVDGWLAGIGAKAGARPIVFVAQNVGVLVGAEFSEQHVLRLVNTARQLFDDAVREVSPVPYTVDEDGELIPYRVPRGHQAWQEIRSAEATLISHVYGAQYEGLRADLEAGLTEDFAAKVMHFRKQDGTESTAAAWTDTVPTLLPRVHNVSLTHVETGDTFFVPWEILAGVVDLEPVDGIYPARYRVENHPDEATMAALRAQEGIA